MSDLEKYLKYKNKYIKYKKSQMTGGFAFMDTKEDKYLLRYINDFLNKDDTKSFFNYNGTTPIKTFDETVNRFNSNEYLKIYEYLIDLYYDPEKYSRTYNKEEIKDIHKYHIHFAALILINYFAELELHTLFYYNYGVNTVSKTDRNNIKCLEWSNSDKYDTTRIYLDDVYEDVNTKIENLCKKLDELFFKFMVELTMRISHYTHDTHENVATIVCPLRNRFKSIRIDWKKQIEQKYPNIKIDLNLIVIYCLREFISEKVRYIAEGFGFYDFMYLTLNKKKNTSVNYGSCVVQSLFELYIMSRLHTKPQNINLVLETNDDNAYHRYHNFIQSKLNLPSVYHWSTEFNLSNSEKHKTLHRQRQTYKNETKLNFSENKLDFAKACFYSVYDIFNVMNNNLKEKKSVEFEKFMNNRINFFENKLFDKLYEHRYINGLFEKSFYMTLLNGNIKELKLFDSEQLECMIMRNKDLIYIVSYKGHVEMLKFLLDIYEKNGIKDMVINEKTNNVHPLHVASMNGHANIVEILLNNVLDKERFISTECNGFTSLYIASSNGHADVIEVLLRNVSNKEHYINKKCYTFTPLCTASRNGHSNVVEILLDNVLDKDNYINTECNGITSLFTASKNGHANVVQILLDNVLDKANLIRYGDIRYTMYIASENGHANVVKILLDYVLDKESLIRYECMVYTPLYIASKNGHVNVVKILLDYVLDKDDYIRTKSDEITPLYIASENGHANVVQILLNYVLDKNNYIRTKSKEITPLFIASENGHVNVVKILLDYVLDKDDYIRTKSNEITPLFIASENGHANVVQILLNYVSNKDDYIRTKSNEMTPLFIASENGHANVVQILLNYVLDKDGYIRTKSNDMTPLFIASQQNHVDIIKILINNVQKQNKDTIIKELIEELSQVSVQASPNTP